MKPKGASLRALRESKHITRRAIAGRVDVSHQFFGRLEADEATASLETFTKIATDLGVPLAAIAHVEEVVAQ
jgi:transcriptional regulator with XRE-family HTH domain